MTSRPRTRPSTRSRRIGGTWAALGLASALVIASAFPVAAARDDVAGLPADGPRGTLLTASSAEIDVDVLDGATERATVDSSGAAKLVLSADSISQWEMERSGLVVTGSGFTPNSEVSVWVDGTWGTDLTIEDTGEVVFRLTAELSPGEHTIVVSAADGDVDATFTVVADDEWYTTSDEPYMLSGPRVLTQAELAEQPFEFIAFDFPDRTSVDVVLNGEHATTVDSNAAGTVRYALTGPLAPRDYTVEFTHPVGTVSREVHVVTGEQGTPPPGGQYDGVSLQTHSGSSPRPNPIERPFAFEVDADGAITGVTGEYSWVCIGVNGDLLGIGDADFSDTPIPATPITAGETFEITWDDGYYTIYGRVNADGTAEGDIRYDMGACGQSILTWSTQTEVADDDVDPVYDPEASASPASLSESELAADGVTLTGTGFAPEADVTLLVNGTEKATRTATTDGGVTFAYTSDTLGTGTHEAILRSANGEASVAFTVTEDAGPKPKPKPDPQPRTIPATPPSVDDLTDDAKDGIVVPETAEPGATIDVEIAGTDPGTEVGVWMFSDPVYLGTHVVGDAGTVQVTIPADAAPGDHTIAAWSKDGLIGWSVIDVLGSTSEDPDDSDREDDGTVDEEDDQHHLPETGSAMLSATLPAALLLLAAGAFLVTLRRRVTA